MRALRVLSKVVTFLLAPLLWAGYHFDLLNWLLPLLLLIFLTSHCLQLKLRDQSTVLPGRLYTWLFGLGALLCALSVLGKNLQLMLYYPVAVNLAFLSVFALSLRTPQSLVELIASRSGTEITPQVKSYTRKVTIAWCVFFILNGTVALTTVLYGDVDLWTLWNGALSYVCIGLMGAGEFLVRKQVQRKGAHESLS